MLAMHNKAAVLVIAKFGQSPTLSSCRITGTEFLFPIHSALMKTNLNIQNENDRERSPIYIT